MTTTNGRAAQKITKAQVRKHLIENRYLYHGATFDKLDSIIEKGLMPRGSDKSNWDYAPSHTDMVYLTNCYGPYFAAIDHDIGAKERSGIARQC